MDLKHLKFAILKTHIHVHLCLQADMNLFHVCNKLCSAMHIFEHTVYVCYFPLTLHKVS